ncbi:leucine-rich repeat domain-containing protein [Adlercreutzia sp. ZJ138]|uniref:leucine-rich repeat domain-containing protein n=1 Tax=Adlercreutzia sp. ZJ138 TaxID=2709405 RepID=UPI0013EB4B0C|nr:leucine-rich repeat domain-containing protein [Adlercreutzia sp. ZJ138]
MFKTVFDYISKHATQFAGATAGLALVGMLGYVLLSGTFSPGFFDEMAWAKNVYKDDRVFGSVSYQVGEVDESDNRIHDNEDDAEGANDSTNDMLASDEDATDDTSASLAGSTVQTDTSTRVGSDTTVVEGDGGGVHGGQGNAGNGGDNTPSGPGGAGEGGEGGNPGGPSAPPITDYQAGQLPDRPAYVDPEHGTLVDIEVTVPQPWSFAKGESYNSDGVKVEAVYRRPDGTQHKVELPYGDGGYTAFLSPTWDAGQHDVTFSFEGISVAQPFTVMGKRLDVAFCAEVKQGDMIKEYAPKFPPDEPGLLNESMTHAAKIIQSEAVPHDVVGGFFTDFSDAQRFMITVLGSADVENAFTTLGTSSYQAVKFLDQLDAAPDERLTSLVAGFRELDKRDDPPLIYVYNAVDGQSTTHSLVAVVEPVPADYKVVRVEGTEDNGFLGDQVLVGYSGKNTEVRVPAGVTKIALEQVNESATSLVIPESVLDIDFESIARCLPKLESIRVSGNTQTYGALYGVLYSADGTHLLYVPPAHEDMNRGDGSWYVDVTTVASDAFVKCDMDEVIVPSNVTTFEEGCLESSRIGSLSFEGDSPVAGVAQSGYVGDIFVAASEYDALCKRWVESLGGADGLWVGVRDTADQGGVKPGTYVYDKNRGVVVLSDEPTVLAGVPFESQKSFFIPDGITAIGAGAFATASDLREVVAPESMRELRQGSLAGLGGVSRVVLPGSKVVSVDADAFGGEEIPDVTVFVPDALYDEYLDAWSDVLGRDAASKLLKPFESKFLRINNALYQTLDADASELRLVEVQDVGQTFFEPDERTVEVTSGAFSGCDSLEIVHLPSLVKTVAADAFAGCENLETVVIDSALRELPSVGDAVLCQSGNGVAYDYDSQTGLVYAVEPGDVLTLVNVPTDTTNVTVRANTMHLGDEAFKGCSSLDDVVRFETPETLVSVGARCFANCLTAEQADFSEFSALASIGEEVFADCTALKAVSLPDSVLKLGSGAFVNCSSLSSFTAHGLTALDARTFSHCTALAYIDAPSVMSVGDECFYHCESLGVLKGAVKRFSSDGKTVYEDALDLDELTWIGDRAFAYCLSFGYDKNRKLELPALEHVGVQAFMGCPSLKEAVLPASLTELGEEAFRDCVALDTLHATGSLETIGRYCFYGCVSLAHLDVSESQKKALEVIGACAFSRCVALERLDLSGYPNLSYLGNRAFEGCSGLLRITMPVALTEVSERCFADCPELSIIELAAENPTILGTSVLGSNPPEYLSIWVPNEQSYAGYLEKYSAVLDPEYGDGYALSVLEVRSDNVEKLRGITYQASEDGWIITDAMPNVSGTVMIADSVEAIAPEAFEGCDKIERIQYEFGASISLGDRAFAGCSGLKDVQLNGTIDSWGDSVFAGCENLKTVRVGGSSAKDHVTSIGPRAFAGCASLNTVHFYVAVDTIEEEAFRDCTSLSQIGVTATFRNKLRVIGDRAFMDVGLSKFPLSSKYTALESIGAQAFYNCDNLTGSTIPPNVTTLGEACFANCDNLLTASIYSGLEEIPKDCFKGCSRLWRTGGTDAAFAGLKTIGESAFEGCISLELTGPNEKGAGAWSLEKYTNLEYIGANAFKGAITHTQKGSGNPRLDTMTLAPTLKFIGSHAFDGCIGLSKVKLQSNPEMGEGAFANMRDGFVLEQPGQETSASVTDAAEAAEAAEAAVASESAADTADAKDVAQAGAEGADDGSNDTAGTGGATASDGTAAGTGNGAADATRGAGGTGTATGSTEGAVGAGAEGAGGGAAAAVVGANGINTVNDSDGATSSKGETA